MANISFALTTSQIQEQSKDVTRRVGWLRLKAGAALQPVVKCMGLKKGEAIQKIGGAVQVISVRREPLRAMLDDLSYGRSECIREGFPNLTPQEFVSMFCKTHKGCLPETAITRIEFSYANN